MTALKYGFAVAATDTGHDANAEPLATFATNRQKLVDYAFRAVHTTAESASPSRVRGPSGGSHTGR